MLISRPFAVKSRFDTPVFIIPVILSEVEG